MRTVLKLLVKRPISFLAWLTLCLMPGLACAQAMQELLGAGDTVRITAFRYPDLTTEARISEQGRVSVPMIGPVEIKGMTPERAAREIADRMKRGNYILNPQIEVTVLEARRR